MIALGTLVTGVLQYASGNFSAVYPRLPLPMHKNFAGTAMAFAAVVAYANPAWMAWSKNWARAAFLAVDHRDRDDTVATGVIGLIVAILSSRCVVAAESTRV